MSNLDIAPNVEIERLPDDGWFSSMKDESHRGAWGLGDSIEESLDDLVEAIQGWHVVRKRLGIDDPNCCPNITVSDGGSET